VLSRPVLAGRSPRTGGKRVWAKANGSAQLGKLGRVPRSSRYRIASGTPHRAGRDRRRSQQLTGERPGDESLPYPRFLELVRSALRQGDWARLRRLLYRRYHDLSPDQNIALFDQVFADAIAAAAAEKRAVEGNLRAAIRDQDEARMEIYSQELFVDRTSYRGMGPRYLALASRSRPDDAAIARIEAALAAREQEARRERGKTAPAARVPVEAVLSYATANGLDPEQYVWVTHGGGLSYLQDFLGGAEPGYRLHGGGVELGRGLFVTPENPALSEQRDREYAGGLGRQYPHLDEPGFLRFRIRRKYLLMIPGTTTTYEAALPAAARSFMRDISLRDAAGQIWWRGKTLRRSPRRGMKQTRSVPQGGVD
jgi:hypothetical protein